MVRLSQLRYYHFVDSEDQDMGTLEDLVLETETLKPTYLLLGGGFFEEFMESKGDIDDIDELAPIDAIDSLEDDYVVLSTKLDDLQTTSKQGELPVNGTKFSKLMEHTIEDPNGPIDIELFDFIFNGDNSRIVFNYPMLTEKLMSQGYQQRFEVSFDIDNVQHTESSLHVPASLDEILDMVRNVVAPKMRGKSLINWGEN